MSVDEICEKYGIKDYTINDDNSIDVDGHVFLGTYDLNADIGYLDELPLNFNEVTGDFYCNEHVLTTLKGSPKWVGGSVYVDNNFLTDLEFSPEFVGEDFNCSYNNLTDLKNSPKVIAEDVYCESNKIKTLENFNSNFKGNFYCESNPINVFGLHGSQSEVILDFVIINPIRKGKVIKYLLNLFYEDGKFQDRIMFGFTAKPNDEKLKSNGYEIS